MPLFTGEHVGGNTRRKREQEARDRPIRRKKRSKGGRPRIHAFVKERKNFAVTRLGSLNRVLNGECIKKSLCANRLRRHSRTGLSESNLKLYFGDLINPPAAARAPVVLYRAGMDERGRISATLNCQITATRRSLRTYLNPTWHEPETRERVAPEDIAGNEFPPRVILRCIPELLPCLTFTLCAECVSVRGSKWAEVAARVRSIYRPSFRASRDLLRTVSPQRRIFRDMYRYVKLHWDV